MLDLGFFRSASFSVGTAAVSVAFFVLLGGIFVLTQYLQFAHGYSAIEAGAIMSPMALGLMIGAGSSSKAVRAARPLPSRRSRPGGARDPVRADCALGAGHRHTRAGGCGFSPWTFAMGWVMAPATDAVVGAVPAAKSGVASATNTVARMVSGALGVAVVGSLVSSLYSNDVEGSLAAFPPRPKRAPRTRSAPPTRSLRTFHPERPPTCLRRPAPRSPKRWAPACLSPARSPRSQPSS